MPSLGARAKGRAGCFGGSPGTVLTESQAGSALWMVVRCVSYPESQMEISVYAVAHPIAEGRTPVKNPINHF
jgi:hypothetical protein